MKRVHFLSNMILQPVGKRLKERYRCSYADLDAIVPTLSGTIEADYLVLLLDPRFFYDTFINKEAFERVDWLGDLLEGFRRRNRARILLGNLDDDFFGIDTASVGEYRRKIEKLNDRLEGLKKRISDLEIIDLYGLAHCLGRSRLYNEKNRYLFQSPFTKEGAEAVAQSLREAIERFEHKRRKVIVVDGDNTLWGGIVGEDGIEGVTCDENYPGIAYKRFQQFLLYLKSTGIVLALVSKNNEADVKELFAKKRMPLKLEDFTTWRINWQPKSQNILSIAEELNLGADSFVFVDDNPFELEEVSRFVEGIATVQADKKDPLLTIEALRSRPDLQAIIVTEEDRKKSEQYREEKARSEVFRQASDLEAFIRDLDIKITWWLNNQAQLPRITQLINKTNQFNLTTRRYTQAEVEAMMRKDKVFSFKVEDRFGDMGIVGVVIVKNGVIDTFLLSCRVLGRGIEDRLMDIVVAQTPELTGAEYLPSAKNAQVESLYERLGFECVETKADGSKYYHFVKKEPQREYIRIERGNNG